LLGKDDLLKNKATEHCSSDYSIAKKLSVHWHKFIV